MMAPQDQSSPDHPAVMRVPDIQVKVCKVSIAGLERTKNDIAVEQVKDVLKADTLQTALLTTLQSQQRLSELGIFKHVHVRLDTAKDHHGNAQGLEVVFLVREYGRLRSSLAANAGTQSGDASLSLYLRNLFGRAEQLRVVSSTTLPHWGQTVQLQFSKPYYKDINKKLLMSVGTTTTKHPFSGYQAYTTGSSVEVQLPSWLGLHTLAWGYDWRQVYGFTSGVPLSIREEAGHSLKSSIRHTLETDERDDLLLPQNGYRVRVTQEVAGLGGDVQFGKAEVQSETYWEIFRDWILSVTLWGGVMRPYSPSKISDRFLLGGQLPGGSECGELDPGNKVGGGNQGLIELVRECYSLGGEAYWASGVHLFSPLPFTRSELFRRIRIHSFMTAGNLIHCRTLSHLGGLVRNVRCSCGLGLHIRLGVAQIELNYCLPLRAQTSDQLQPGVQFGIGLEML